MAHAYSKLYNIPSTGLRFFTVYGPAGDLTWPIFGFTDKLKKMEKTIKNLQIMGNCKKRFSHILMISLKESFVLCRVLPRKKME